MLTPHVVSFIPIDRDLKHCTKQDQACASDNPVGKGTPERFRTRDFSLICSRWFDGFLVARWGGAGEIAVLMGNKRGHARTENSRTGRRRTSNCANSECNNTTCKESTGGREHSSADGGCDGDGDVVGYVYDGGDGDLRKMKTSRAQAQISRLIFLKRLCVTLIAFQASNFSVFVSLMIRSYSRSPTRRDNTAAKLTASPSLNFLAHDLSFPSSITHICTT